MADIDSGARHDEWLARKDEIASAFEGATTNPVVDRVVGVWLMASGVAAVSLALLGQERGVLAAGPSLATTDATKAGS